MASPEQYRSEITEPTPEGDEAVPELLPLPGDRTGVSIASRFQRRHHLPPVVGRGLMFLLAGILNAAAPTVASAGPAEVRARADAAFDELDQEVDRERERERKRREEHETKKQPSAEPITAARESDRASLGRGRLPSTVRERGKKEDPFDALDRVIEAAEIFYDPTVSFEEKMRAVKRVIADRERCDLNGITIIRTGEDLFFVFGPKHAVRVTPVTPESTKHAIAARTRAIRHIEEETGGAVQIHP